MKDLIKILKSYSGNSEKRLENGTLLICKTPHLALYSWLHVIYPPLYIEEIRQLEIELKQRIPSDFLHFLLKMNGLSIFSETLEIFGKRNDYKRDIESAWQPYDIVTLNSKERISNSLKSYLYFGAYGWDGSLLYIDVETQKVNRCDRNTGTVLNKWEKFDIFLLLEINRISKLFDQNGVKINKDKPSVPIDNY